MKMQLTYKYRLYPSRQQAEQIRKTCHCVRYVYNKILEEKTRHYRKTGKWMDSIDESILEKPFLKDVDPEALTWAQRSLKDAYQNFFYTERNVPDRYRKESILAAQKDPSYKLMDTDLVSYPRYKKRKTTKESYTTSLQTIKIEKSRIRLPYVGNVKIRYHRQVPQGARIICGTVLGTPSGNYYLLIQLELPEEIKPKELQTAIGVALQPRTIAFRSDGVPVFYRHMNAELDEKIARARKTLARRKPGSKRYEKKRQYLASLYEHRANQRRDDLHKAARQIVNAADAVYMQRADVRRELRKINSKQEQARLLDEATWTFTDLVRYKTALDGKRFWRVPRECFIYSICSNCHERCRPEPVNNWTCPKCGERHNLHHNAALNMQKIGEQYIKNYST